MTKILRSYFLKYELERDGVREEVITEVVTCESIRKVRSRYTGISPFIAENEEDEKMIRFSLKSVVENQIGIYWDS